MKAATKKIVFSAIVFGLVCLLSGTVYAMGGGGHNGDGRSDVMPNASPAIGTSSSSGTSTSSTSRALYAQNPGSDGNASDAPVTFTTLVVVPEPTALFLLGLGFMGLAGIKRKLKK